MSLDGRHHPTGPFFDCRWKYSPLGSRRRLQLASFFFFLAVAKGRSRQGDTGLGHFPFAFSVHA